MFSQTVTISTFRTDNETSLVVIMLASQQNTIWHLTIWEVRRRWTFKWVSLDHWHFQTSFWSRLVNLILLLSGSEALSSGPWNLTISRSTESCDRIQWSLRDSSPWEPYSTYYRYFEFNSNWGEYTNWILVINRGKFVSSDATEWAVHALMHLSHN